MTPHLVAKNLQKTWRHVPAVALGLALSIAVTLSAASQSRAPSEAVRAPQRAKDAEGLNKLRQRDMELERVRAEQKQVTETEASLKKELVTIGDDRRKLNQALIDTAERLRSTEAKVADSEN